MKKKDLRNGAILQNRVNSICLKIDNVLLVIDGGYKGIVLSLNKYNNDLSHKDNNDFDIIKVKNPKKSKNPKKIYIPFVEYFQLSNFNGWTWKRED